MREFFNQVINVEDILHPEDEEGEEVYSPAGDWMETDTAMSYYYRASYKQMKFLPPELSPDLDRFDMETAGFKYQSVMLSVPEIKLLMDLVLDHSEQFITQGFHQVVTYAQNIKKSSSHGDLFKDLDTEGKRAGGAIEYLMFIDEKLPHDQSVQVAKAKKGNQSEQALKSMQVEKLKEAVINLLCSLDSFAMFFANSQQTSLLQIVEFVLKFTYLFERRKSSMQGKVPLKILAQFIWTQLLLLPEDFQANGYLKLYQTISKEYEKRYQTMTHKGSQNKQILLMCNFHAAISMMEKHIEDLNKEHRSHESFQRTKRFLDLIRNAKLPVCLFSQRDGCRLSIEDQTVCPHSHLDAVNSFVMGKKSPLIVGTQSMATDPRRSTGAPRPRYSGHATTIEEFSEEFAKTPQAQKSTEQESDDSGVSECFFSYLERIRHQIDEQNPNASEEEHDATMEEVEKYITRKMKKSIFPSWASPEDEALYRRTVELSWVRPEHLDIPEQKRSEEMWSFAIKALKQIDDCMSPVEKLGCLVEYITIIVNVLELCSGGGVSADDSLPIIIYLLIQSQPQRMHSNFNFISKFRHAKKMLGQNGFCFSQMRSAIQYIMTMDHTGLTIDKEEYDRKVAEASGVRQTLRGE